MCVLLLNSLCELKGGKKVFLNENCFVIYHLFRLKYKEVYFVFYIVMHEYWQFHKPILYSKCDFCNVKKKKIFLSIFRFRYLTDMLIVKLFNKIRNTATLYSFVKHSNLIANFLCHLTFPFVIRI